MTLKKILKYILRFILGLVAFLALYLLAAFLLARIGIAEEAGQPDEMSIHILTNGVHTDIVVPTRTDQIDWSERIRFSHIASTDTVYPYLAMGWGDKGFYLETPTWAELKPSVAFKAATGISTTAIHATYYKTMTPGEDCREIKISKAQYARLIEYITNSFQTDSAGDWIKIETDANYGETDAFYEANGRYSMFRTCNAWANSGLAYAGQKHAFWTPFDTGIFLQYD